MITDVKLMVQSICNDVAFIDIEIDNVAMMLESLDIDTAELQVICYGRKYLFEVAKDMTEETKIKQIEEFLNWYYDRTETTT